MKTYLHKFLLILVIVIAVGMGLQSFSFGYSMTVPSNVGPSLNSSEITNLESGQTNAAYAGTQMGNLGNQIYGSDQGLTNSSINPMTAGTQMNILNVNAYPAGKLFGTGNNALVPNFNKPLSCNGSQSQTLTIQMSQNSSTGDITITQNLNGQSPTTIVSGADEICENGYISPQTPFYFLWQANSSGVTSVATSQGNLSGCICVGAECNTTAMPNGTVAQNGPPQGVPSTTVFQLVVQGIFNSFYVGSNSIAITLANEDLSTYTANLTINNASACSQVVSSSPNIASLSSYYNMDSTSVDQAMDNGGSSSSITINQLPGTSKLDTPSQTTNTINYGTVANAWYINNNTINNNSYGGSISPTQANVSLNITNYINQSINTTTNPNSPPETIYGIVYQNGKWSPGTNSLTVAKGNAIQVQNNSGSIDSGGNITSNLQYYQCDQNGNNCTLTSNQLNSSMNPNYMFIENCDMVCEVQINIAKQLPGTNTSPSEMINTQNISSSVQDIYLPCDSYGNCPADTQAGDQIIKQCGCIGNQNPNDLAMVQAYLQVLRQASMDIFCGQPSSLPNAGLQ